MKGMDEGESGSISFTEFSDFVEKHDVGDSEADRTAAAAALTARPAPTPASRSAPRALSAAGQSRVTLSLQ